jgi:hypothetical protein
MTSTPPRLFAPLLAIALAACGPSAQPAQPTTPTAPAAPTASAEPTAAAPATAATAAATAAAVPMQPGPNLTPNGVVFVFKPDGFKGKKIFLAGNFNDWNPADPKYLMTDDGSGTFTITVKLFPGTYQYKYVADGTWIKDPSSPSDAPDGFGGRNGKFDVK